MLVNSFIWEKRTHTMMHKTWQQPDRCKEGVCHWKITFWRRLRALKKKSVYWFVKRWLVLATGLSSSAGTGKYPWSCWKTICEKLWTGQIGFSLRWMTLKSKPKDSQTTIIILVSGSWSANHYIDPCMILGERSACYFVYFGSPGC